MTITGEQLITNALDMIAEAGRAQIDDHEMDRASAHSAIVLDSLNREPETAVGGVVRVRVELPAGVNRFTWGPQADIDSMVPSDVNTWSIVDAAGVERSRGQYLVLPSEWAALQEVTDRGEPMHLYWPKTLVGQHYEFFVHPTPAEDVGIVLYASVPKLDRIDRGRTYTLDPGRGEYLVLNMAVALGPLYSYPIPPSVYSRLQAAADRLQDTREVSQVQAPSTPGWAEMGTGFSRRLWRRRF